MEPKHFNGSMILLKIPAVGQTSFQNKKQSLTKQQAKTRYSNA
jgi:hypothetical protein